MNRVRNLTKQLLSDFKCKLEKVGFDYRRNDDTWQTQQRVVFTRKDASVVLLFNRETKKILVTRQFRLPTFLNGNESGMLDEACAGTIDDHETPEQCILREITEETGYKVKTVTFLFDAYLSPGSVTERLYFFIGEYNESMKNGEGGGTDETEDIEVAEMPFEEAFTMISANKMKDAKTLILLQYAKINNLLG